MDGGLPFFMQSIKINRDMNQAEDLYNTEMEEQEKKKNTCVISPDPVKEYIRYMGTLGINPIPIDGASIMMDAISGKLPEGHHVIKNPEFQMSLKTLIACSDVISKLAAEGTHTFEVYTSSSIIASRVNFDEVIHYDNEGNAASVKLYGRTLNDILQYSY